ncbi:MAG: hypothetical protein RLZZ210_866 [Pseudomonadota bacterium]
MLKISTWNVNSLNVRLEHVLQLLQEQNLDILCLQELKIIDAKFPLASLEQIGYKAIFLGQPTYNGVAIIYKNNLAIIEQSIQYNMPNFSDESKRFIQADFSINQKTYTIICAYFPNGQALDSDKFVYKLEWLNALQNHLSSLNNIDNTMLLGDYNITFDSKDIYDPSLEGGIFASEKERSFFTKLTHLNMIDVYRHLNQNNQNKPEFTWWDYRMGSFKRNLGLRIDHIWVGKEIIPQLKSCVVNKEMRKLERPSDHAPVTMELGVE